MKKLIFLLLIPVLIWGQSAPYNSKYRIPFNWPDTLKQADTLAGGWMDISDWVGSITLGLIFDSDPGIDSLVGITLQGMVGLSDFSGTTGQAMDDSVYVGSDSTGWMSLGVVDSVCIADSTAWLYPISIESWWNYFDMVKFRLISPATNDTCILKKAIFRGQ